MPVITTLDLVNLSVEFPHLLYQEVELLIPNHYYAPNTSDYSSTKIGVASTRNKTQS